nr:transglutaminase family protein [Chthoniobacterales bacterium]
MLIKIGFDIEFELRGPTPMILMLFVHPSRQDDLRQPEELLAEPAVPVSYYLDLFG